MFFWGEQERDSDIVDVFQPAYNIWFAFEYALVVVSVEFLLSFLHLWGDVMLRSRYVCFCAFVWVQFHVSFRVAQYKGAEKLLGTLILQWLIASENRIN